MIYITTSGELTKDQKLLASLPATDTLFILYSKTEASIPIEAYQMLSSLKCKVEFIQWSDNIDAQLKFMFDLGVTCGTTTGVRVLTAKNYVFAKVFQNKPTRKRGASAKSSKIPVQNTKDAKPEIKTEEIMPAPISVQEKSDKQPAAEKKKRAAKPKLEDDFDKAYSELEALFSEVKTKEYNPLNNLNGIVKAAKSSITEKRDLKESFKVWFPDKADKIIKVFEGKESRLLEIVTRLDD